MVYAKKSFNSSESVFEYLARYTHKIAISNQRIKSITQKDVTFEYLDRDDDYKKKLRTVSGEKFGVTLILWGEEILFQIMVVMMGLLNWK